MIPFSKGELAVINDAIIDEIYYWKYEEKLQAAKKWNGPYINEPKIDKSTFFERT